MSPEEEDNVVQKWKKRGGKRRSGWVREAPPGPRCYISSPLSGPGQRGWRAKRNGGTEEEVARGDLITCSGRRWRAREEM